MKIRNGFVANSSSSCFILDKRITGVEEMLKHCKAALPEDYSRSTAMAIGQDAVNYLSRFKDSYILSYWNKDHVENITGQNIREFIKHIGTENVVFMRESDEGMGGYLFCGEDEDEYSEEQAKLYKLLKQLSPIKFDDH